MADDERITDQIADFARIWAAMLHHITETRSELSGTRQNRPGRLRHIKLRNPGRSGILHVFGILFL